MQQRPAGNPFAQQVASNPFMSAGNSFNSGAPASNLNTSQTSSGGFALGQNKQRPDQGGPNGGEDLFATRPMYKAKRNF